MRLLPRKVRLALAIIAGLSLLTAAALPALAATGLGIGPSRVILDDALRGGEYVRKINILNTGDELTEYALIVEGELASWVSFYADEALAEPAEAMVIHPGSSRAVYLRVAIPEDTPTEAYQINVTLVARKASGEEEGSSQVTEDVSAGAAVSLLGRLKIEINVTGTQNLSGVLGTIHTYDTEVNYPLKVVVPFENTGNVKATPTIRIEILQGDAVLTDLTYQDATVDPGNTKLIEVSVDTADVPEGEYRARVTVSLGEQVLETKELAFKVLPVGTLTREGTLEALVAETDARVGQLFKAVATFANTGQIETPAKFVGEVYRDGNLLTTIESNELIVLPAAHASLPAYYKVEQTGDYLLRGAVNYGGKLTETMELSFTAVMPVVPGSSGMLAEGSSSPIQAGLASITGLLGGMGQTQLLLVAAGAIALVLVMVGIGAARQRRRGAPAQR